MNYKDIKGWISNPEAERLIAYAKEAPTANLLEVGSLWGKSSSALAEAIKDKNGKLVCVDIFPDVNLQTFQSNMAEYKNVEIMRGDSTEILPTIKEKFGMIFIDSNHTEPYISRDIESSWNLLEDNGILALHDYNNIEWPDVRKAVQAFMLKHDLSFYNQAGSANLVALKKCSKI